MLRVLFLLTSVAYVLGAPQVSQFNPEAVGLDVFNQQYQAYQAAHKAYELDYRGYQQLYEQFKSQWEKFWNNLVSQFGQQGAWEMLPSKIPGFNASWNWVQSIIKPGGGDSVPSFAPAPGYSSASVASTISTAGANAAAGFNQASGINALSGANALSGLNSNAGQNSNAAYYNQLSGLSTSGSNSNSGTNVLSGTNSLSGTNTGPNNYNSPLSGASSVVNQPSKEPIFIQGAMSNVGNAGSIYVP